MLQLKCLKTIDSGFVNVYDSGTKKEFDL